MVPFLAWWYSAGWWRVLSETGQMLRRTTERFSFGLVLSTLFAPWKQDIVSGKGSLDAILRAFTLNIVSRFIGLVIRLGLVLTTLIILVGVALGGLVLFIIWPVLPISIVGLVWLVLHL